MDELAIYKRAFAAISRTSLDEALSATLEAMIDLTGADRGFVLTRAEGDAGSLVVLAERTARGAPKRAVDEGPSDAVARRALETSAPVRLENALEDPDFRGRPSVLAISLLSVLSVPIVSEGEAIAVVYLDSVRVAGIFSADAEAVAAALVAAVAPALGAATRLRQSKSRESALLARLHAAETGTGAAGAILGRSPIFTAALDRALRAARSDAPILLEGESGTGKELFARAIHRASARAKHAFVAINCGAIPEATLEAELFGYRKGAFTGALQDRAGRVEAADRGTLFLDEIGDMPAALQVKLLRFLQSGEIQKLGETREVRVDARVVAATHRDLRALVREGKFREDLLYRLRVVAVAIPPLRRRGDDVLLLAQAFARRSGREAGREITSLSPGARERLLRHQFPGNVRELENAIRHAAVFAVGAKITEDDLPPEVGAAGEASPAKAPAEVGAGIPRDAGELQKAKEQSAARIEREFLRALLERAGGNVSLAARTAGMSRPFLHEVMARHGVQAGNFRPGG